MKKLTLFATTLFLLVLAKSSFAQQQQQTSAPHAFKYQAVARNANGDAIANQNVSFRISIVQGSENGITVYQETQTTTTNQFGLAGLSIGRGTPTIGTFDSIQWGNGSYFVKIEFDPSGGTNYFLMSSSEMLSVPYSLYSENSGNVQGFPVKAALQATNVAAPFNNPETGMLVYNTDSAGTFPTNVVPGYYYNAGTPEKPRWAQFSAYVWNPEQDNNNGHRALTPGSGNTTYGGSAQDISLSTGSVTTTPSGNDNTGFGTNAFGTTSGTTPSGSDNTCAGYEASYSITGASSTTGNGFKALYNNTASEATAMGDSAAYSNTTGVAMTAFGYQAASASQTAQYLTAFGFHALLNNNNSGVNNTALGDLALNANTSGVDNLGVGFNTAAFNSTGSYNTALGSASMYYNTTGSYNTVTGFYAMKGVSGSSTSSYNTANGYEAMYGNTTGGYNSAAGALALYNNTSASQNTAIGYEALYDQSFNSSAASDNVAVGFRTLYQNQPTNSSNGYRNTAVGDSALFSNTTGSNNTGLGYKADVSTTSQLVYATAIGSGSLVTGNNCMALGGNTGTNFTFVGIAEPHPLAALVIADADSGVTTYGTNDHIKSEGQAPTPSSNLGVTPVMTGSSTDVAGNVSIGNFMGSGTITVTFSKSYNLPPIVVLTPTTSGAATIATNVYVTSTTTSFVINISGISASQQNSGAWNYHVIEPN